MRSESDPAGRWDRPKVLLGIQYLRGVGAMLVVADHADTLMGLEKYTGRRAFDWTELAGEAGVALFFIISGVIIFYVSVTPTRLEPRLTAGQYVIRRFCRIMPILWFCTIGYLLLRIVGRGDPGDLWEYARTLALFPVGTLEPSQAWTLRHEMLFYLIFAIYIAIYARSRSTLAAFAPIVIWGVATVLVSLFVPLDVSASDLDELLFLVFGSYNYLFLAGVGLTAVYLLRVGGALWRLPDTAFAAGCWLAAVGYAVAFLAVGYRPGETSSALVAAFLGAPVMVLAMAFQPSSRSWAGRLAQILGDASYSIYLTHGAVLATWLSFCAAVMRDADPLFIWTTGLLASAVVGTAVHVAVERRLVGGSTRWLSRKLAPPAAEPHRSAA